MALNCPTKLLVDEMDIRNARVTIHCCIERAAAIASGIASRKHIEMTHRSSIVDENRSSLSMSSSSLLYIDENATCAAQNRHAYCASRGIVPSTLSFDTAFASSLRFKSVSTPSDSRLFNIARHRRPSRLS